MIFVGHKREEVERILFLKKIVNDVETLDMGSADGKLTRMLINSDNVTAIDFYEDELKNNHAQKKVLGDIRKLPFENNSFDQVLLFEVLEHQKTEEDRKTILNEARRVLRVGGKLILSTPNRWRLTSIIRKMVGGERSFPYMVGSNPERTFGDFHYIEYSSDELKNLCNSIGFSEVEIKNYYFHIPYVHIFFKIQSKLSPGLFAVCQK